MKVVTSLAAMQEQAWNWSEGNVIGFVPTMGFLHEGHLSLVRQARANCDLVVVSIFVNPSQFGPQEDLSTYPRDIDNDLRLLKDEQADIVFFPSATEMYASPYHSWVNVEGLSEVLCGKSRPGHFRGVATVVLKLVNLVNPNYMYMGEKDFQQVVVLQAMLRDLNFRCRIVPCPIVREQDGLAKSSRNVYLKGENRQIALCLSEALALVQRLYASGEKEVARLLEEASRHVKARGGRIDYIKLVNPHTLQDETLATNSTRMIMAVYVGTTRLIDNAAMKA